MKWHISFQSVLEQLSLNVLSDLLSILKRHFFDLNSLPVLYFLFATCQSFLSQLSYNTLLLPNSILSYFLFPNISNTLET